MTFNCNGIFVSTRDERARFSPESPFDTSYGEPWFLKNEPYDCETVFPKKNSLRTLTDMNTVKKYINAAAIQNYDVSVQLLYSKIEEPCINRTLELSLLDISTFAGYDILSLSVNYSLLHDTLVNGFSSGEVSFDDNDSGLQDRVEHFRERLNSRSLFETKEDAAELLLECHNYFIESCEKLVIPGWNMVSEEAGYTGSAPLDDNLICKVYQINTEELFRIFKETLND